MEDIRSVNAVYSAAFTHLHTDIINTMANLKVLSLVAGTCSHMNTRGH
jgi:hypothetical protein